MRAGCLLSFLLLLASCSGPAPYRYHYVAGKTAVISNGVAVAPPNAPPAVQEAIAAGNRITGSPYIYGGGHSGGFAKGFDCSGAASFLLSAANLLDSPIASKEFRSYGSGGAGEWISVYARKDHVFLVIAGLRFDTGWTHGASGPQWTTLSRPADGCVIRHPVEL